MLLPLFSISPQPLFSATCHVRRYARQRDICSFCMCSLSLSFSLSRTFHIYTRFLLSLPSNFCLGSRAFRPVFLRFLCRARQADNSCGVILARETAVAHARTLAHSRIYISIHTHTQIYSILSTVDRARLTQTGASPLFLIFLFAAELSRAAIYI